MALEHKFLIVSPSEVSAIIAIQLSYLEREGAVRYSRRNPIPRLTGDTAVESTEVLRLLMDIYKKKLPHAIGIPDDYILSNLDVLENVYTLADGLIPYTGLLYYGITLIPDTSLVSLIDALLKTPTTLEMMQLVELCNKAVTSKSYVLHCGI